MKFSVAATLGVMVAEVQARVCRALAMSGGGSNGAWEAGVIYGFAHSANPEDFYYDVVSGISAGSINTAALAPWAPEDIVAATEFISETWNTLTNDQIWSYQPDIAPIQGEGVKWELGLNGFMNY
jgi:predicted acylesterase/phospholipase RssA